MDSSASRLDAAQRAAVDSEASALLVVAGPGSGKTRVLTHRIARRVDDESIQARHVVAVTFTRRAAHELRSRLRDLGVDDTGPVGTFHSIALAQLRQYDIDRGRSERKVLANRAALSGELAEHLRNRFGARPPVTVAVALREIDWAKASDLSAAEYRDGPGPRRVGSGAEATAELYSHYERTKTRRRMLDFDDLLIECTRLMHSDEHFANARRWLHRHFFVDEFQDLNRLQWNLLVAWLGGTSAVRDGACDICVVGDTDQAIYGWNGADSSYIAEFDRRFDGAEVVHLKLNYRSHPLLVAAASAVMSPSERATPAQSQRGGHDQQPARPHEIGPAPTVTAYDDEAAEADGIARWITAQNKRWGSFGVLARTNAQLHDIAAALGSAGIPHRIGGQRGSFGQLREVRELLDRLRASGADFASVVAELRQEANTRPRSSHSASSDQTELRVLDLAAVYLDEQRSAAGRRNAPLGADGQSFAAWIGLLSGRDRELTGDLFDIDRFTRPGGAVTLVTFHAAKGLEWRHVVIAGAEDGLVPLRDDDPEERRLFYVAVSRATHALHFTWARHRSRTDRRNREPSPWLALIEHATAEPPPLGPQDAAAHLAAARAALDR